MWLGAMRAGETMGEDEVAMLADAARAHKQLTGLHFLCQCRVTLSFLLRGGLFITVRPRCCMNWACANACMQGRR